MNDLISFSKIAYRLAGKRLLVLIGLVALAAIFEGLGVSLFLPLLLGVDADNTLNQLLSSGFSAVHLPYTFRNVLVFMVLFFFLRSTVLILKECHTGKIISYLLVDLRCRLTRQLFDASYEYMLKKEQGYVNNAIMREFDLLLLAFKTYASILVSLGFVPIYILLPLILNPTISIGLFAFGMPFFFIIKKINLLTKRYSVRQSKHMARLHSILVQTLNYFKYLKATASYPSVLDKVKQESQTLGDIQYKTFLLQGITKHAFEPFALLALAGLVFYQVEILGKEVLEIAFLIYLLRRAINSLIGMQQSVRKFFSSVGSIRVYQTFDTELTRAYEKQPTQPTHPKFDVPIRFEQVSFTYASGPSVIENLTFEISPNTTIAFVGSSGSGKSTLVNLLTGILKPTSGQIFLGNQSFETLNTVALRNSIGYITQENVIFNDTIANNISLWTPSITQTDIIEAAKKAHIHDFIQGLPDGYHTLLGNDGLNVSGGQRQRIMIARELCKQTSLLIFDEATSALDGESEQEIQKNIDEFRGQKTIILIAHRLSTIKNSDCIFVLDKGQIVEQGTYQELCTQNSLFKRMVAQQITSESQTNHEPLYLP